MYQKKGRGTILQYLSERTYFHHQGATPGGGLGVEGVVFRIMLFLATHSFSTSKMTPRRRNSQGVDFFLTSLAEYASRGNF